MTKPYKTIEDCKDLRGARVLLRGDLNVPFQSGCVTDKSRLEALAPTVKFLKDHKAITILLSHFGRPGGEKDMDYSLRPVAECLVDMLGYQVTFVPDCIGKPVSDAVADAKPGDILICENLRFYSGETDNDPEFVSKLAKNGDIFVNDAFSAAHRAHASTSGLASVLPAYAGKLMDQELSALSKIIQAPARPITAVVGGAKVSTKLDVLENLVSKVDHLILGGGMANTFLFADGTNVGKSLHEPDMVKSVERIMTAAKDSGCIVHIPTDFVVADKFEKHVETCVKPADQIGQNEMALDIGPESIEAIKKVINTSRTLLWNGPMGAFEVPPFDCATNAVAQHAAAQTDKGDLYSVGGGGDTVAALENAGAKDQFSYISAAGGAFLEFIEGKTLPGVEALKQA